MNCDPNVLAEAARCFDCLSPATLEQIQTYLMCQWVDALGPPVDTNFRIIDTLEIRSTDTGDLRIYV